MPARQKFSRKMRVMPASGCNTDGIASKIVGQPGTGSIQKPFTIKKLAEKINAILQY